MEPTEPTCYNVEMIDFSSTSATNLISLILMVVTGVYVFLTWKIANSNEAMLENLKEQNAEAMRPNVLARLKFREGTVAVLTIINVGRTSAYDLKIDIDRDFFQFACEDEESNVATFPVFLNKIENFAPEAFIDIDLAQGFNGNYVFKLAGSHVTGFATGRRITP